MVIFKKGIVFVLMHRLDFPMIKDPVMEEFGTFSKIGNAELNDGPVGDLSYFMINTFDSLDCFDDGTDMTHTVMIKTALIRIDKEFPFNPFIGLLDRQCFIKIRFSFGAGYPVDLLKQ